MQAFPLSLALYFVLRRCARLGVLGIESGVMLHWALS